MTAEATPTSLASWASLRQFQRDLLQRLNVEDEELARASIAAAEAADLRYDSSSSSDSDSADGGAAGQGAHVSDQENVARVGGDLPHHACEQPNPMPLSGASARAAKRQELRETLLARSIPLPFLVDYLRQRRSATRLVVDLILFLPLLFLALNLFVFRSDVSSMSLEGSYYAAALRTLVVDQEVAPQGFHLGDPNNDVNGPHHLLTFRTVRSVDEWHLWFERVLVPTFYNNLDRDAQPSRDGPLPQCVLASAIRLRTFRVTNHSCVVPSSLVAPHMRSNATVPCYGPYSDDGVDTTSLFVFNTTNGVGGGSDGYLAFEPVGTCGGFDGFLLRTRAEYATYACGGYTTMLNGSLSFTQALAHADAWAASGVLSNAATRFVSVDVILYHTALDLHLLAEFSHEITEGGAWYPFPRLTPFRVLSSNAYPIAQRVSDAWLALLVGVAWTRFFSQWILAFQENRRSIGAYFFDPWTIVNLTYLVCLTVTLVLIWVQAGLARRTSVLRSAPEWSSVFPYELMHLARIAHWTRYFIGVAAVMLFLKVIEFVRLNSRLNILTRTLARVAESVVGVLALFCLFMAAFALSGHVLHGTTLHAYSTLALSFATSMLALMGSFDYAAMRTHDPQLAFVYFFSFVILGLFVLLQFITAVIGAAFDEERLGVRLLPLRAAIAQFVQRWGSYDRVQEHMHLYIRCVKAFHSISPNVMWNRVCQHVETAVALDAMLRAPKQPHHQQHQDTPQQALIMAQQQEGGDNGMHHHHLVGLSFLVGAIGKEDVAVLTLPQVESIFLDATRAHDRIRPSEATAEHLARLDMVEGVVADRIKAFMASPGIVGRIERKATRITGQHTTTLATRQSDKEENFAHGLVAELAAALRAGAYPAAASTTQDAHRMQCADALQRFTEDASARLAAVLTRGGNSNATASEPVLTNANQDRGGPDSQEATDAVNQTENKEVAQHAQVVTLRRLQHRLDTAVRTMSMLRAAVPEDT